MFSSRRGTEFFRIKTVQLFPTILPKQGTKYRCPTQFVKLIQTFQLRKIAPGLLRKLKIIKKRKLLRIVPVGKKNPLSQGKAPFVAFGDKRDPTL